MRAARRESITWGSKAVVLLNDNKEIPRDATAADLALGMYPSACVNAGSLAGYVFDHPQKVCRVVPFLNIWLDRSPRIIPSDLASSRCSLKRATEDEVKFAAVEKARDLSRLDLPCGNIGILLMAMMHSELKTNQTAALSGRRSDFEILFLAGLVTVVPQSCQAPLRHAGTTSAYNVAGADNGRLREEPPTINL
jgi:hypothetical protein